MSFDVNTTETILQPRNTDRNSSRSGFPKRHIFVCNHACTQTCVYKMVDSMFVLGVIANMVVMWRVIVDKRLRTPTFVAIACLAFSDAIFLSVNLISVGSAVYQAYACTDNNDLFVNQAIFKSIKGFCWFASNAHISIIAAVRYVIISCPLKAQIHVTKRRILSASVVTWFVGIGLWMTHLVLQLHGIASPRNDPALHLTVWATVYFSPLVITVVLHIQKWRNVRKSSKKNPRLSTGTLRRPVRMTKIILIIILLATILPLPKFILEQLQRQEEVISFHIRDLAFILFLANSSINPILYAFLSEQFKKSFRDWVISFRTPVSAFRQSGQTSDKYSTNCNASKETVDADSTTKCDIIRTSSEITLNSDQSVPMAVIY